MQNVSVALPAERAQYEDPEVTVQEGDVRYSPAGQDVEAESPSRDRCERFADKLSRAKFDELRPASADTTAPVSTAKSIIEKRIEVIIGWNLQVFGSFQLAGGRGPLDRSPITHTGDPNRELLLPL